MDQSPTQNPGALGGNAGGQQAGQPGALALVEGATGGQLQEINRNLAVNQQVQENRVVNQYNFYFQPQIVQGDVKVQGDMYQSTTKIRKSEIGSLTVSPSAASGSTMTLLPTPSGGALALTTPGETGSKEAVVTALQSMLKAASFPKEQEKEILAAIQYAGTQVSEQPAPEQEDGPKEEPTASPTDKTHFLTDEIMNKLNDIKLEDNTEQLVKQGFEALLKNDKAKKSTLGFINAYKKEESSTPSEFYQKHKDLKNPLDQVWEEIYLKAATATCERHLEDNVEITRALARICANIARKLMQQNDSEHTLSAFTSRVDDVISMGNDFFSKSKYIHAVISYFVASKLLELNDGGDETTRNIGFCVYKIKDVVEEMAKQESTKRIVMDHVIPLMRQMIEFIRSTESASHKVKVKYESCCLMHIGHCYHDCDEYQQYANENESAIELMKREFGEEAETYRIYGICLNNAGVAYRRMGDHHMAFELFTKSLEAYDKVNDWRNEENKNIELKRTKNNLRVVKSKLGK